MIKILRFLLGLEKTVVMGARICGICLIPCIKR